jgi:hypothetical protein
LVALITPVAGLPARLAALGPLAIAVLAHATALALVALLALTLVVLRPALRTALTLIALIVCHGLSFQTSFVALE